MDETPKVIDFQTEAIGRLRARVDALGEANAALLTFARGYGDAAARVHAAVLAALDAGSLEHLVHVITQDWVDMLGLDAIGLALETSPDVIRLAPTGLQFIGPGHLGQWLDTEQDVSLRTVEEGAPLFGPAAGLIRAEALIRLPMAAPWPRGILALGSRVPDAFEGVRGTELFTFLGAVCARCLARWLNNPA